MSSNDGLTSYARINRVRPFHLLLTVAEGLLGLLGVVVLILTVRYGSFEKAGAAMDKGIACAVACAEKLVHKA